MDTNNWKALLLNDANFDQKVPYDLNEIVKKMDIAVKDLTQLNPYYVLSPVYDFTKFFAKISSALSMGFSDITEKVEIMRKLYKEKYSDCNTIQELIEKEIKLGIHKLNGDNNDKHDHKKGNYKKYISGTRTFLRLLWFMEFLIHIFRKLLTETDLSMKDILKNSYEEVLAPRHPWIVRTAVNAALTFSGTSKNKAIEIIFHCKETTPEKNKKIKDVTEEFEKIWKAGHDYYEKNDLLGLE